MTKEQYDKWTKFREKNSTSINQDEFQLVCELHSDLFNHKFYKPCTCRPQEINKWIKEINQKYNSLDVATLS